VPTALITGSTDGIGLETARQMLDKGWRILVHGRNQDRAASAVKALGGPANAVAVWADLASMEAVLDLAAQVGRAGPGLDLLMLNAGVYESKRSLTSDGFERTLAVNHFSHLLLSLRLRTLLQAAPAPRIVWVSSGVHHGAALDLGDLELARGWSGYGAYAASKLANAVTAAEMARRPEFGGVVSVSLHPGVVGTKLLTRNFGKGGVPLSEGAKTTLFCALSPDLKRHNGGYYSQAAPARPDPRVEDPVFGRKLWDSCLARLGAWI
jgi:NAD(P)-dependent dehydrogenase (short-subunit alcohol dehydrogenase family)